MEVTEHDPGVPSWVDVGTDLAKGRAFYSSLFGWDCPEGSEETGFYSTATLRGKPVAGIGPQQDGMPSVWTTYVNVDSADEVAEKDAAAGGFWFRGSGSGCCRARRRQALWCACRLGVVHHGPS